MIDAIKRVYFGAGESAFAGAVLANAVTAAIEVAGFAVVSLFGHTDAATTIKLQYSVDGTNFFDGPTTTLAGAADFYIDTTTAAKYVRAKTTGAATITGHLAVKG